MCTNVPRSAALRGALSQLSPPSDAAPERPRVPLGSAQRFERFVADAAPERPRVPLGSAQRFERFVAAGFCPGHSTPAVAARAPGLASSERKERKVLPSVTKRRAYDLS